MEGTVSSCRLTTAEGGAVAGRVAETIFFLTGTDPHARKRVMSVNSFQRHFIPRPKFLSKYLFCRDLTISPSVHISPSSKFG